MATIHRIEARQKLQKAGLPLRFGPRAKDPSTALQHVNDGGLGRIETLPEIYRTFSLRTKIRRASSMMASSA